MNSIVNTYITRVIYNDDPCSRIMKGSEQIWPVISPIQPLPDGSVSSGGYAEITVFMDNPKLNMLLEWVIKHNPAYNEQTLSDWMSNSYVYFEPISKSNRTYYKNSLPDFIQVDGGPMAKCFNDAGLYQIPEIKLRDSGMGVSMHKIRIYWKTPVKTFNRMFKNNPASSPYSNNGIEFVINGRVLNGINYPYPYQWRWVDYDFSNVIPDTDVDFTSMFDNNIWARNINLNIDCTPRIINTRTTRWTNIFNNIGMNQESGYSIFGDITLSEGMSHILTGETSSNNYASQVSQNGPLRAGMVMMYNDLNGRTLTDIEREIEWNFTLPEKYGRFIVSSETYANNPALINWDTIQQEPYMKLYVTD